MSSCLFVNQLQKLRHRKKKKKKKNLCTTKLGEEFWMHSGPPEKSLIYVKPYTVMWCCSTINMMKVACHQPKFNPSSRLEAAAFWNREGGLNFKFVAVGEVVLHVGWASRGSSTFVDLVWNPLVGLGHIEPAPFSLRWVWVCGFYGPMQDGAVKLYILELHHLWCVY